MSDNLRVVQVDAFTNRRYGGNPCAVVLDADRLSASAMQTIAREMNLSETAFVMSSAKADFRARYFTPASEIPLAGHPTISTIFTLIDEGQLSIPDAGITISLELEAGVIPVDVEIDEDGGHRITMTQPRPEFLRLYAAADVLPAFGLGVSDIVTGAPVMTVSTGTPQLMVPIRSLDALERAQLDAPLYRQLRSAGDFFSPHLFVLQGATRAGTTFARHFRLPPDTPEDPFTGSATGSMAAYLFKHELLPTPKFIAEQGHWMGRPGQAQVEVITQGNHIAGVKVGGYAVKVMSGEIIIPDPETDDD